MGWQDAPEVGAAPAWASAPEVASDPTEGMSGTDKFLAGVGKSMYDAGRGVGQLVGAVSREDIDEARRLDAPLMQTTAGKAGAVTGGVATFAPAMFIPGANTAVGASLVGAGMGALSPVGTGESRLANTAAGGALGLAGQQIGQRGGRYLADRLANRRAELALQQGQNAERDATVAAAREAGYVIPPSSVNPSFRNQVLESISGKIATAQTAAARNQGVTERLVRQSVGLADDRPITREAMQGIRNRAFNEGYAPVGAVGKVKTDAQFIADLDGLVSTHQGAARSFPGAVPDGVNNLVNGAPGMHGGPRTGGLKVAEFDADDALKMVQVLRDKADEAYIAGDKALGKARKGAAKALEDQIERSLSARGEPAAELLKGFRDARQLMAKTHTVERAVREGSGGVTASKLAAELQRGKPLTGELATAARFANLFPRAAQAPEAVAGPAVHNLKAGLSTILGSGGALAAGPVGITAAAVPFVAPAAARSVLFSRPVQNALSPTYQPGIVSRALPALIDNEPMNALLRLGLPSIYATQE